MENFMLSTEIENPYNRIAMEPLTHQPLKTKVSRRLCLPSMKGFIIIDVNDILYFHVVHNYTVFHLVNGKKIMVTKPIKDYEAMLNPDAFFRTHKSSVIHLKYLKEFSRANGNFAVMTDNTRIAVSRRRLSEFKVAVNLHNNQSQANSKQDLAA